MVHDTQVMPCPFPKEIFENILSDVLILEVYLECYNVLQKLMHFHLPSSRLAMSKLWWIIKL